MVMLLARPVLANDEHGCMHESIVLAGRDCVIHAAHAGHIDNQGVTQSLLAKLDTAQATLDSGQAPVVVNNLMAFVQAVEAQAGRGVPAPVRPTTVPLVLPAACAPPRRPHQNSTEDVLPATPPASFSTIK
jgi:hypothetical protein